MATTTEHYGLTKPDEADFFDMADWNGNMDTIDSALAETAAQMDGMGETLTEMNGKIGTAADTGTDTLFGLAKQGGSLIKSIQRVTYQPMRSTTEGSVSIAEVNVAKCIVLFERLEDNSQYTSRINYTLTETSIDLTFSSASTDSRLLGFWVVEFY